MPDKIDRQAEPRARTDNTLGVDDQSTQPSSIEKSVDANLPIEFGRYRLLKQLGERGMGVVYLAHDIELDRQIALKLPHFSGAKSKDLAQRFRREARLAATLDHPNICRIYDISEYERRLFLTMAFVEGKSLHELIRSKGAVEPRTAVTLLRRIAQAVHYAHSRGVIHRDLKPANIMIKKDRDFVIMDFGLARRIDQEEAQLTATGAVLGTPAYMAPEQLRGEKGASGPQSDVYSLGIIFYELLTGQRPFQGTLPQIYAQVLTTDSVSPSLVRDSIETALDEICQRATNREASQRYESAEEFASALNDYLLTNVRVPSDDNQIPPNFDKVEFKPQSGSQLPMRRHRSLLNFAAGTILVLLLLGSIAITLFSKSDTTTSVIGLDDKVELKGNTETLGTTEALEGQAVSPQKIVTEDADLSSNEAGIDSFKAADSQSQNEGNGIWEHNSAGIKFVWIPSGAFKMGDEFEHVWVTLSRGFWLGQTEITQGQWKLLMGTEPWEGNSNVMVGPNYAASHVNWLDAVDFCRKLTESEQGQGRLPMNWSYCLPSEAQWEYACRAGTTTRYSFGDEVNQLSDYAWWGGRYGDGNAKKEPYAHEVANKRANEFGLYDMHGNVWEWCQDWKGDYGNQAVSDPTGPNTGTHRVFRGGCWHDLPEYCRSSCRYYWEPGLRADFLGFRVAIIPTKQ